jgi:hypothetical protein
VDPAGPLPSGKHTFQLVVVDDQGQSSLPATVDVVVRDKVVPTAVIKAPQSVPAGQSFTLDGSASNEVPPGKIVKFIWTMTS